MRTNEDIIRVRISSYSLVDLDWERIEEDPRWAQISIKYNLDEPEQKRKALFEYLGSYVSQELLFDSNFMPSTNGPSSLWITDMEDVTHGHADGSEINRN